MSNFKQAIKNNVLSQNNKYSLDQEKIAEVLQSDSRSNTCTLFYKNSDGTGVTRDNVLLNTNQFNINVGFPKKGDYLEIREVGKSIRIVGRLDSKHATSIQDTTDSYSKGTDISGYLGI